MRIHIKKTISDSNSITEKDILDILLKNRKIDDRNNFLSPPHPTLIPLSFFGFKKEFKKTIKLLEFIKKNNQMIVVYTDYDADGITGGAIMWETLHLLGFKVMPYVPHRQNEGYGFSKKGIDNLKKQFNPALIISVDHGITAREKISYAKSLGIPVIITDHHLKPDKIPGDALAIFHIPALSGAGVAYFLAKEIFKHFKKYGQNIVLSLQNNFSSDYLALAAIGAIADLVPLTGPTRALVFHGLQSCFKTKRQGLLAIFKQAGIIGKIITPYEVGFIIAPRINAIGRLSHAIDALRLLCTTNSKKAEELAGLVGQQNQERQDMVKKAVEEATKIVKSRLVTRDSRLIILASDDWHEGIIGLIASRMVEEFYRPVIIMTKTDGFFKASARSIPALHITEFLRGLKKYLVDVGGHAQAAGFTIEKSKVAEFIKKAEVKANKLIKKSDLEKTIEVDLKMPFHLAREKLAKALEALAPFGMGNPQPRFVSTIQILDAKIFGKTATHLKIVAGDTKIRSYPLELIGFGMAKELPALSKGQLREIVYSLEIDRWGGREKVRGRIIHINTA